MPTPLPLQLETGIPRSTLRGWKKGRPVATCAQSDDVGLVSSRTSADASSSSTLTSEMGRPGHVSVQEEAEVAQLIKILRLDVGTVVYDVICHISREIAAERICGF